MATGTESICCLEINNTDKKMINSTDSITVVEEFKSVCTSPGVITTAMVVFQKDNGPIPAIRQHE